jgi:nucleoside-diphosphate-sugar epimerase
MNVNSKQILVTGGSGLVGARLLPRLQQAGWECRALLRDTSKTVPGVTTIEGDLSDPQVLAKAVDGVSAVVHLAAVFRTQDSDLIWKSNLEGTRNLIDAVQANSPQARFIMASTAHVYSADNPHPGREDDAVTPAHPYPASKAAAELLLRESGLTWSVLRFPFVYGDGDGHLESLPAYLPTFNWHPAARMSTVHHRDIATAIHMALNGIMDSRIVNIADDAALSVYELLKLVGTTMPSSAEPLQNPWQLHIDTSLARSLGFAPTVRTVYQGMQPDGAL